MQEATLPDGAHELEMTSYRKAIQEWLGEHGYTHWFTGTFGKKWVDGPSPASVAKHTRTFLSSLGEVGPWFFVVERGRSGMFRCHSHGLVGPRRRSLPVRSQHLWSMWGERFGRSEWQKISDQSEDLRSYLTKYVTKEAERRLNDLTWDVGCNGGRI